MPVETLPFADIIRTGSERGLLLSDGSRWKIFRTARGATSHSYDEDKARAVFATIPDFFHEVRDLRDRLRAELR